MNAIRGFSPGGSSLAPDDDFRSQEVAAQLITLGGIGAYSNLELGKVMTGKVASASAYITETEEGVSGGGSTKDMESLFQLLHMRFTAPRADAQLFGVVMSQTKAMMANQDAQPEFVYNKVLQETMFQNHVRRMVPTLEQMEEVSLDKALAFYKDRFADASDFTFVIVGTVEPATLKPLVEQYLASLPSTGRTETFRDMNITRPKGVVERVVEKGIEPKSQTTLTFHGPMTYDREQRIILRAMGDVLQTRLREALREELGGTYSVGVSALSQHEPKTEFTVTVGFGSDPANADALAKRVFEEVATYKAEGPTAKQVDDVKAALTRDFETNIKQNAFVLNQLLFQYKLGEAPEGMLDIPSYYEKISAAGIQAAAKRYLDTANYVKVVLMPEKR